MNRKMKDSGIAWIGEIPSHWEICRVKSKYDFITGFTPESKNPEYYDSDNGKVWITISDLNNGYVSDSISKISAKYITEFNPRIVPQGSLLYSFKLSIGQTAINEIDLYTNEAIASFLDNENVCLRFLRYSCYLIEFNANTNIYGASLLNQELIKNALIISPPLLEQRAIADYLDNKCSDIDSLIALKQKKIEELKEYKKSMIYEYVTGKKEV